MNELPSDDVINNATTSFLLADLGRHPAWDKSETERLLRCVMREQMEKDRISEEATPSNPCPDHKREDV